MWECKVSIQTHTGLSCTYHTDYFRCWLTWSHSGELTVLSMKTVGSNFLTFTEPRNQWVMSDNNSRWLFHFYFSAFTQTHLLHTHFMKLDAVTPPLSRPWRHVQHSLWSTHIHHIPTPVWFACNACVRVNTLRVHTAAAHGWRSHNALGVLKEM